MLCVVSDPVWKNILREKIFDHAMGIDMKKVHKKDEENNYVWIFYRKASIPFTRLFMKTTITPNQLSVLGFFLSVVAIGIFFFDVGFWHDVLAFVIYQFTIILDFCDGSIARLKNMSSVFGHYLDGTLDIYRYFLLFLAISYRAYQDYAATWIILLYIIYSFSNMLIGHTGNTRLIYSRGKKDRIKVLNVLNMGHFARLLALSANNIYTFFVVFFSLLFILENYSIWPVAFFLSILTVFNVAHHILGSYSFYRTFNKEKFK